MKAEGEDFRCFIRSFNIFVVCCAQIDVQRALSTTLVHRLLVSHVSSNIRWHSPWSHILKISTLTGKEQVGEKCIGQHLVKL